MSLMTSSRVQLRLASPRCVTPVCGFWSGCFDTQVTRTSIPTSRGAAEPAWGSCRREVAFDQLGQIAPSHTPTGASAEVYPGELAVAQPAPDRFLTDAQVFGDLSNGKQLIFVVTHALWPLIVKCCFI